MLNFVWEWGPSSLSLSLSWLICVTLVWHKHRQTRWRWFRDMYSKMEKKKKGGSAYPPTCVFNGDYTSSLTGTRQTSHKAHAICPFSSSSSSSSSSLFFFIIIIIISVFCCVSPSSASSRLSLLSPKKKKLCVCTLALHPSTRASVSFCFPDRPHSWFIVCNGLIMIELLLFTLHHNLFCFFFVFFFSLSILLSSLCGTRSSWARQRHRGITQIGSNFARPAWVTREAADEPTWRPALRSSCLLHPGKKSK